MSDKALRQYIYEKYDLKVKRIGLCGPYYTLSFNYDSQGGSWEMTDSYDDYGYLLHNKLFTNLAELLDTLVAAGELKHLSLKEDK